MAVLTEEQSMLRDAARSWVQEKSPVSRLRALRDQGAPLGFDPAAYSEMAEMGWAGVVIPEVYGGSDFGYLSLGLVLEELGKTLAPSPLLSCALAAASALVLGGDAEQKQSWLPKIADGSLIATLAVDEGPRHDPAATSTRAEPHGSGFALSGVKRFVPDGMAAQLFIVAARTSGAPSHTAGVYLFLVPADVLGVSREARKLADARGYAEVTFDGVLLPAAARLRGEGLLEMVLDRARAGLSAEMLGSATQAFETTLDYLKTRVQFGQTIGSFQALQHRAARMFTELELTRSCVEAALSAIDEGSPETPTLACLAKASAGETLNLLSREMVQMHGGIGMTDAHDAGFYLKRARVAETLYGSAAWHRDRYGRLLGY